MVATCFKYDDKTACAEVRCRQSYQRSWLRRDQNEGSSMAAEGRVWIAFWQDLCIINQHLSGKGFDTTTPPTHISTAKLTIIQTRNYVPGVGNREKLSNSYRQATRHYDFGDSSTVGFCISSEISASNITQLYLIFPLPRTPTDDTWQGTLWPGYHIHGHWLRGFSPNPNILIELFQALKNI